jgi:uncharacterized zinc-type alcohol dehydrogenase-like protein
VTAVGTGVSNFKPGQIVGVGPMVDSCRRCASCNDDLEQYCENCSPRPTMAMFGGAVTTLTAAIRRRSPGTSISCCPLVMTKSTWLRWRRCSVRVSPLGRRCAIGGTGPGKKVGIGGLGHMGLKLAKALGAHVVAFTFPH